MARLRYLGMRISPNSEKLTLQLEINVCASGHFCALEGVPSARNVGVYSCEGRNATFQDSQRAARSKIATRSAFATCCFQRVASETLGVATSSARRVHDIASKLFWPLPGHQVMRPRVARVNNWNCRRIKSRAMLDRLGCKPDSQKFLLVSLGQ